MTALASMGINSFKFFMAYKVRLDRHLPSERMRWTLLNAHTRTHINSCTHSRMRTNITHAYTNTHTLETQGSLQVSDEELLLGFQHCRDLGALPMVRGGGKRVVFPVQLRLCGVGALSRVDGAGSVAVATPACWKDMLVLLTLLTFPAATSSSQVHLSPCRQHAAQLLPGLSVSVQFLPFLL